MGPMSPSAIPGRVEMGLGIGFEGYDGRSEMEREREVERERVEEAKKRRGFRVLFRWGRKSQSGQFF